MRTVILSRRTGPSRNTRSETRTLQEEVELRGENAATNLDGYVETKGESCYKENVAVTGLEKSLE